MPQLTFLEAPEALVKTYALDSEGKLVKESYPNVWNFTSHTYEVSTLEAMCERMRSAASKGWCLLKGELQRELKGESRAGSTDPNTLTPFICLDFDRLGSITSIEQALGLIGLGSYSYIVQYSASHGVEPEKGCTAHVIMMLSAPAHPASLKQWLISLNLKTEAFREVLCLTRTQNAISWGLDVSTCQNDKLIYIAPPRLGPGVRSTHQGERIQLVKKDLDSIDMASLSIPTAEVNRSAMNLVLDELRTKCGAPKRSWTTRTDKATGLEILAKPDASTLTGVKQERGFTYFNLNGGDSWGYYSPDDAPEIIRNFKGEANYLTSELLPEYWAQLQAQRKAEEIEQKNILRTGVMQFGKLKVLVFRDFQTALYYNGTFDEETGELLLAAARTETQLQHFLIEKRLPEADFIATWNLIYDPYSDVRVDDKAKILNTFKPSPYAKQAPIENPQFPTIQRVLENAIARDPATLDHWINNFACIFKLHLHTMTSWALHGIEGTGKGLLVYKILIPLLGHSNVTVKRMSELEENFNQYLETSQLVVIDEADMSDSRTSRRIMANLKNQITEPEITIRRMYAPAYTVKNHCNFLFLSNMPTPVMVSITDRRFNVGEFRDEKLQISDDEIAQIERELPAFASYLLQYAADPMRARSVLVTEERTEMMMTSLNSLDQVALALREGDLPFFWETQPAGEMGVLSVHAQGLHNAYTKLMHEALRAEHGVQRLTREELRVLVAYNVGDGSISDAPNKFTQTMRHKRIYIDTMRIDGAVVRGLEVHWRAEPSWITERLEELAAKQPALKVVSSNVPAIGRARAG